MPRSNLIKCSFTSPRSNQSATVFVVDSILLDVHFIKQYNDALLSVFGSVENPWPTWMHRKGCSLKMYLVTVMEERHVHSCTPSEVDVTDTDIWSSVGAISCHHSWKIDPSSKLLETADPGMNLLGVLKWHLAHHSWFCTARSLWRLTHVYTYDSGTLT